MSEKLEVYNLDSELIETEDRKEFYDEIKSEFEKTGGITKKVKTVGIILMNSAGRIYLQKRSKLKEDNSGLHDKTVGGHVEAGDSYNMTVVKECAEELGFPATVMSSGEFDKAVKNIYLETIGVFKEVDKLETFESKRLMKNGSYFVQPNMASFFIGYYDGPIKFVDGESSGIEVFSLDELKEEIKTNPDKFTEDIKFMVQKYEKFLVPIK